MKRLILVRGLPGSGKSTYATQVAEDNRLAGKAVVGPIEADQYFMVNGAYVFDQTKLGAAHSQCFDRTEAALAANNDVVIVSNTFTTERELRPYLSLATKHNYQVVTLVVENRHGNKSIHDVPEEAMARMRQRFSFSL